VKCRAPFFPASPSGIAERNEDEADWHEIVQRAESSTERANLHNLTAEQRRELINTYRARKPSAGTTG
jgi:hypothetical protein